MNEACDNEYEDVCGFMEKMYQISKIPKSLYNCPIDPERERKWDEWIEHLNKLMEE